MRKKPRVRFHRRAPAAPGTAAQWLDAGCGPSRAHLWLGGAEEPAEAADTALGGPSPTQLEGGIAEGRAKRAALRETILRELLAPGAVAAELCERALEKLGIPEREALMGALREGVRGFARVKTGSRFLQLTMTAPETCNERRYEILGGLRGDLVAASKDPHANHLVQVCITTVPVNRLDEVLFEIAASCRPSRFARHAYGCRVVQRLLENADPGRPATAAFTEMLAEEAIPLCMHYYGNYVVQALVENSTRRQCGQLVAELAPHLTRLCRDGRGAGTFVKILQRQTPEWTQQVLEGARSAPPGFLGYLAARGRQTADMVDLLASHMPVDELQRSLLECRGLRRSRYGCAIAVRHCSGGTTGIGVPGASLDEHNAWMASMRARLEAYRAG